jgi:RNA polymerase-binding transcription factor DksA
LNPADLTPLDKWALNELAVLVDTLTEAFERYEFHRVYQLLNRFYTVTLSARYHDFLKDRLYTFRSDSHGRRSAQTVIYHQFETLTRLWAPVLVFTCEEAFEGTRWPSPEGVDSVHLADWPTVPESWRNTAAASEIEKLILLRDPVNEKLEALRADKKIGKSVEAALVLSVPEGSELAGILGKFRDQLAELFIVSMVDVHVRADGDSVQIEVRVAEGDRCPRCWRTVTNLVETPMETVCDRCADALEPFSPFLKPSFLPVMPKKKTATKKKSTTRKSPADQKDGREKDGGQEDRRRLRRRPENPTSKKAAKKATASKKASDYIKRPSHTPAIFKPTSKRPAAILFTIEEVRDVLKKRAKEESKLKAAAEAAEAEKKGPQKAVGQAVVEATDPPKKSKHAAASLEDILGLSGGGAGSAGNANKVPKKFKKYYDLLMELRQEVRDELNLHTSDTLKRSQKEDAGDIAISVDAGTDNFDRDFALSLLSSEQEALNEIEAAIERIHKGTYGVCEVTGEPIKDDRLEAVPFTRFSVEGQKQYEMNMRKRVSRAGAFLNEASGEKITFGDDDGDN